MVEHHEPSSNFFKLSSITQVRIDLVQDQLIFKIIYLLHELKEIRRYEENTKNRMISFLDAQEDILTFYQKQRQGTANFQ